MQGKRKSKLLDALGTRPALPAAGSVNGDAHKVEAAPAKAEMSREAVEESAERTYTAVRAVAARNFLDRVKALVQEYQIDFKAEPGFTPDGRTVGRLALVDLKTGKTLNLGG